MRFVHAADLHIDSPLLGLASYEGAPLDQIRRATRRALENLVQLCIDERAELLVVAGDMYDDDWRDYATGLFVSSQLSRLSEAGVRVVWIRGNHDAKSKITRHLTQPKNVYELSTQAPQTLTFDDLGVAVHGMGYPVPAVTDDISHRYPPSVPGRFNIGLLHTALDGRPGHARYAPCSLEGLVSKGYEYFALGHVHRYEVLHEAPWVVFAGNLQGRHMRETGAKGAVVVEVEHGKVVSQRHSALDVVRFCKLPVDATAAPDFESVVERVERALEQAAKDVDGRVLAVRVEIHGVTAAHKALVEDPERLLAEVRSRAMSLDTDAWVEGVQATTTAAYHREELGRRPDAVGALISTLDRMAQDDDELSALAEALSEVKERLPHELWLSESGKPFDHPDVLRAKLLQIEALVLPAILPEEGA